MSKINVGVVGCGYWGPNLVRNFHALSDCRVRMVCDPDENRRHHMTSLFGGVEAVGAFDRMLNGSGLDAVVIATPVRSHYELAKASLESGKHTFIEKPMAMSSVECEALIDVADQKGLTLMVGHTFLYSSPVRKIKQIIKDGDIGAVQYISSRRLNLGLFQKDINVAWDLAPHDISIVLYLLDDVPVAVNCQGRANVTPGIEDVTSMSVEFRHGEFACIHNSWLEPRKVREMTIVGTRRMIVYDDVEPLQKIRIYDMRVERPPHYDTFAEFQYSYHYGDMYAPHIQQEEPLRVEGQHFLDCIQSGERPLSSGRQGQQLVRILEASSLSIKAGGARINLNSMDVDAPREGGPPPARQTGRVKATRAAVAGAYSSPGGKWAAAKVKA